MTRPLVSVAMPVFNCGNTIEVAIRSILNQSYGNWQLLVVDDGSTDKSVEIATRLADPRISVFVDNRHRGTVHRLNQAVAMTRGEYFARMDADDVAYPQRLERQIEYLTCHPEVDLLGCGMLVFKGDGIALGCRVAAETHDEICGHPLEGFPLGHPTWMGRTEWFRAHPYDAKAVRAEDQVLLFTSYSQSRFACLAEILHGYREDKLVLTKILRGRYGFVAATLKNCLEQRDYLSAISLLFRQCAKASLDVVAVSTGLKYLILSHRVRPVGASDLEYWDKNWSQLQKETYAVISEPALVIS
jgi:glycosyltransferase involved in cell wall biosynthesis